MRALLSIHFSILKADALFLTSWPLLSGPLGGVSGMAGFISVMNTALELCHDPKKSLEDFPSRLKWFQFGVIKNPTFSQLVFSQQVRHQL